MSWTQETFGTTTTDGTEQTLATTASNASYVFRIDTSNMANGDEIEIRVKTKVLTGDSAIGQSLVRYVHAQSADELVKELGPFSLQFTGGIFTLKEVAGSHRAYKWSLHRV